jgi:hypothetical protein
MHTAITRKPTSTSASPVVLGALTLYMALRDLAGPAREAVRRLALDSVLELGHEAGYTDEHTERQIERSNRARLADVGVRWIAGEADARGASRAAQLGGLLRALLGVRGLDAEVRRVLELGAHAVATGEREAFEAYAEPFMRFDCDVRGPHRDLAWDVYCLYTESIDHDGDDDGIHDSTRQRFEEGLRDIVRSVAAALPDSHVHYMDDLPAAYEAALYADRDVSCEDCLAYEGEPCSCGARVDEVLRLAAGGDPRHPAWREFLASSAGKSMTPAERRALQAHFWQPGRRPTVAAYHLLLAAERAAESDTSAWIEVEANDRAAE